MENIHNTRGRSQPSHSFVDHISLAQLQRSPLWTSIACHGVVVNFDLAALEVYA